MRHSIVVRYRVIPKTTETNARKRVYISFTYLKLPHRDTVTYLPQDS